MHHFFPKVFLLALFLGIFFSQVFAQGILSTSDPDGCERVDRFLPNLVICGRHPASGACPQYTKPCSMADLVETGRRILIWIITLVLLFIPIVITYVGVKIMFLREFDPNSQLLKDLKRKILWLIIYFVCLLGAWLIVRAIVDVTQVKPHVPMFLIDKDGNPVRARQIDFSR